MLLTLGAAKSREVERVLLASFQLDGEFPDRLRSGFVAKYKALRAEGFDGDELERDVQAIGFQSLTIVRPSMIGGQRNERRLGESVVLRISKLLGPVLPKKFRTSPAQSIAEALIDSVVAGLAGCHFRFAESLL